VRPAAASSTAERACFSFTCRLHLFVWGRSGSALSSDVYRWNHKETGNERLQPEFVRVESFGHFPARATKGMPKRRPSTLDEIFVRCTLAANAPET
jgi:hypothetical protein